MNSFEKQLEIDSDKMFQNLRYESPQSPTSPRNALMKTKLSSFFSNLQYFEKEGRKIIRKSLDKQEKVPTKINSKYMKRSLAIPSSKYNKLENKIKQDSLPILHMSQVRLMETKSPILFFQSNQFYPNKTTSKAKLSSSLSQYEQYQRLIKILKCNNQNKPKQVEPKNKLSWTNDLNSNKSKRSDELQSFRSTSIFFRTRKGITDSSKTKLHPPSRRRKNNMTCLLNY